MSFQKQASDTELESGAMDSTFTKTVDTGVAAAEDPAVAKKMKRMEGAIGFLGACSVGLLVSTIVLAIDRNNISSSSSSGAAEDQGPNPCSGKRPDWPNIDCINNVTGEYNTGPQAGANVTKGYQGSREVDVEPLTGNYREAGLCPVNVHWHLGTEHYSAGEYDENGSGPIEFHEGRIGFQCSNFDENLTAWTQPYEWKYCIGMTIGQTYEIHWPHSQAGMCNTPWQYQTPFYDGVFCQDGVLDLSTTAEQIGVQAQVFTVINSDSPEYQINDLFSGMIVNEEKEMGTDIAYYTGSTTGTARDNEICSPFSPITWQVDRKCHIISAASFDEMCRVMTLQADNLKDDLYAHGSRMLVSDEHAADNQQRRKRRELMPQFIDA